ncbi:MAG: hypothetical protein HC836_23350 [Richelia sp. RM2_1_2]|nr:hypothetical protein [Richelia sp. RM2_1_2]
MPASNYQEYLKRFISDTFISVYFAVEIATPGVLAAPADGFIDDLSPENYAVNPIDPTANPRATGSYPTTKILSLAKERANMRWEEILTQCSLTIQPTQQLYVSATGATHNAEATTMSFVLKYDRPEYVATEDELTPGTILVGADAVKRFVARALVIDIKKNRDLYNPDIVMTAAGSQVQGPIIEDVTAAKIFADLVTAEASITVIESDLTT